MARFVQVNLWLDNILTLFDRLLGDEMQYIFYLVCQLGDHALK